MICKQWWFIFEVVFFQVLFSLTSSFCRGLAQGKPQPPPKLVYLANICSTLGCNERKGDVLYSSCALRAECRACSELSESETVCPEFKATAQSTLLLKGKAVVHNKSKFRLFRNHWASNLHTQEIKLVSPKSGRLKFDVSQCRISNMNKARNDIITRSRDGIPLKKLPNFHTQLNLVITAQRLSRKNAMAKLIPKADLQFSVKFIPYLKDLDSETGEYVLQDEKCGATLMTANELTRSFTLSDTTGLTAGVYQVTIPWRAGPSVSPDQFRVEVQCTSDWGWSAQDWVVCSYITCRTMDSVQKSDLRTIEEFVHDQDNAMYLAKLLKKPPPRNSKQESKKKKVDSDSDSLDGVRDDDLKEIEALRPVDHRLIAYSPHRYRYYW